MLTSSKACPSWPLDEYAELKAQAADFDPGELYKARQVIRPAQEKAAALTSRRLYTWACR